MLKREPRDRTHTRAHTHKHTKAPLKPILLSVARAQLPFRICGIAGHELQGRASVALCLFSNLRARQLLRTANLGQRGREDLGSEDTDALLLHGQRILLAVRLLRNHALGLLLGRDFLQGGLSS